MQERLQKILSARGIASRRKAEEYIEAGLVKVNGKVAKVGDKADAEKDSIEVDGQVLKARQEMLYYVLNKPVGYVTTNIDGLDTEPTEGQKRAQKRRGGGKAYKSPTPEKTVRDLIPKQLQGKIYPVGRLDKDSSGLLLFTNDGVLAFRLTHPKFDHQKEYLVTLEQPMPMGALRKLEEGIMIDGSKTKPAEIDRVDASTLRITLTEGRYRQIRRMCQKVGSAVKTLQRIRIMTFEDPNLKEGQLRILTGEETKNLLSAVGI
ncbi:MAG TPA: pseudouridine synthase [Candidatus Peribacteraceae bacterium]|nr:pseudouridine synthase [Candidatus Peribacteraceae bacterium]